MTIYILMNIGDISLFLHVFHHQRSYLEPPLHFGIIWNCTNARIVWSNPKYGGTKTLTQ